VSENVVGRYRPHELQSYILYSGIFLWAAFILLFAVCLGKKECKYFVYWEKLRTFASAYEK
jgi:hypothetical protein